MITRPAGEAVDVLRRLGLTLASAESLTGGGVGEAMTAVPGSSAVYVGGVVSYATRVKVEVLGVPAVVVEQHGVVSAECAGAMAARVRVLLSADVGVATTGVAGPDPQEGKPVGLVYVAVADGSEVEVQRLSLRGDRRAIREATVRAVLQLVVRRLTDPVGEETGATQPKPMTGS